jgi:prepilin peptidase CpaA
MNSDPAMWPALALALFGAFVDVRERRLPNWLCAALALAGGAGLAISQGPALLPWGLLHAVIALAAGMALFGIGAIGGGDAKFYAAAALAVPASPVTGPLALLGWTSVAGLLLLVAMVVGRRGLRRSGAGGALKGWTVPYGVAVAGGLWLTILRT